MPIFVVLALAYYNYALAYVIAYREIFRHRSRAGAIIIWVFMGIFQITLFTNWLVILVRSPGKAPHIPPFDLYESKDPEYLPVPDAFLCDQQGYPFWCSQCNSLKAKRTIHSSRVGYCVKRFDHNCIWIGNVIGRDNFVPFIHFCIHFWLMFVLALVCAATTVRSATDRDSSNIPHYAVVFVLSFLWIIMILAVLGLQIVMLFKNKTTMDDLAYNQSRKYARWERAQAQPHKWYHPSNIPREEKGIRYINVAHGGTRKVVSFGLRDYPYNQGFTKNLTYLILNSHDSSRVWKAALICIVPMAPFLLKPERLEEMETYDNCSEPFSPSFLASIDEKIANGEFSSPSYIQPPAAEEISEKITNNSS